MNDQLQPQNTPQQLLVKQHGETYSSPMPAPETLKSYKDIDPSFPERIMRMAEAYNATDIRTDNRISLSHLVIPIIGQVSTFLLGAGGILACVYLARIGYTGGAVAVVIGGFIPTIFNTFKQRK